MRWGIRATMTSPAHMAGRPGTRLASSVVPGLTTIAPFEGNAIMADSTLCHGYARARNLQSFDARQVRS